MRNAWWGVSTINSLDITEKWRSCRRRVNTNIRNRTLYTMAMWRIYGSTMNQRQMSIAAGVHEWTYKLISPLSLFLSAAVRPTQADSHGLPYAPAFSRLQPLTSIMGKKHSPRLGVDPNLSLPPSFKLPPRSGSASSKLNIHSKKPTSSIKTNSICVSSSNSDISMYFDKPVLWSSSISESYICQSVKNSSNIFVWYCMDESCIQINVHSPRSLFAS